MPAPSHATDPRAAALRAALPGDGAGVIARAPGRVNLIGEHTDYNGLPVLPIAIDRDVMVAARPRTDGVVALTNADPAFPPRRYGIGTAPPLPPGDWGNYPRAAAEALAAARAGRGAPAFPGAHLHVQGTIPIAAGLSSSSALVVASALAHLALAGDDVPPLELAELLARGERYVGTLGGGMDQAAALLSRAGHALRIDFFPLRVRPVAVPCDATFIVAQSLTRAEKSGTARGFYNQRVVECRLAAALIARRTGLAARLLGDLPDATAVLDELPALVPEGSTRADLPRLLACSAAELDALIGDAELADRERFVLRSRARHVLEEAARVTAAAGALAARDLAALGALMDASHRSCAEHYEVSTPALDRLVAVARAHGALGARLTGAGFGGAIVALALPDRAAGLLSALDRDFYQRTPPPDARLVVTPSDGASVTRFA